MGFHPCLNVTTGNLWNHYYISKCIISVKSSCCFLTGCEVYQPCLPFLSAYNYWPLSISQQIFQIRGPVALSGSICPTTRNLVDSGIQSSHRGVDVWNIPKPHYTHNWSKSFQDFPMSSDISGVADLFVKNNSWRNNKKRHLFHSLTKEEIESDFVQFNKPPKMIPQNNHWGLVVVVNKYDGSPLDIGVSGKIYLQLKGTLNAPSILSANEVGSYLQHFYCLNKKELDVLAWCIVYNLQRWSTTQWCERLCWTDR